MVDILFADTLHPISHLTHRSKNIPADSFLSVHGLKLFLAWVRSVKSQPKLSFEIDDCVCVFFFGGGGGGTGF